MVMADPAERCSTQEAFQTLRRIFMSEPCDEEELSEEPIAEKQPEPKPAPSTEEREPQKPYVSSSGLRMGNGLRKSTDRKAASNPQNTNTNTNLRSAGDL